MLGDDSALDKLQEEMRTEINRLNEEIADSKERHRKLDDTLRELRVMLENRSQHL